jgi:hypothetical protein
MTASLLINTLAHEWAREWGANETQANAAANVVQSAWQNDSRRACGGLWPFRGRALLRTLRMYGDATHNVKLATLGTHRVFVSASST